MGPLIDQLCRHAGSPPRTWRLRLRTEFVSRSEAIADACRASLSFFGVRVLEPEAGQLSFASRSAEITEALFDDRRVEFSGSGGAVPIRTLGTVEQMSLPDVQRRQDQRQTIQSVLANLDGLFNGDPLESGMDLTAYEHTQRSVINFGVAFGIGRSLGSMRQAELQGAVLKAICAFESRLEPASLSVSVIDERSDENPGEIRLLIEGALIRELGGEQLRVLTNIDVVNGRARNQFA